MHLRYGLNLGRSKTFPSVRWSEGLPHVPALFLFPATNYDMQTKHLYDSPTGLVLKSLRGAVSLNPNICLHEPSKTVFSKATSSSKRVAVISGGGSGHEPAHAGYTGKGMLDASVAGDIFASPSAKQISTAIHLASQPRGNTPGEPLDVLAIINNYTGDRLNFGLAIEKARSSLPMTRIESVVVADDVSLLKQNASNKFVGPRGLAANILVCKILGALAESGESLEVVKAFGDAVVENLHSLGVGLEHCHVPGMSRHRSGSALGELECELGLGLHNEPGVARKNVGEPTHFIAHMVETILDPKGDKAWRQRMIGQCQDGVVLFINNLGGMSQLEMGAIVSDVIDSFATYGIYPKRVYCSSYMTSLNAPGFSLSVLNLSGIGQSLTKSNTSFSEGCIETLLDMSTEASAWVGARSNWTKPGMGHVEPGTSIETTMRRDLDAKKETKNGKMTPEFAFHIRCAIRAACERVLETKDQLTQFDTIVGDGDCGETFGSGAQAVLLALNKNSLSLDQDGASVVQDIANILEDNMGGTVGALFAIFLNALAQALKSNNKSTTMSQPQQRISNALQSAKTTLSRYTPAQIGDRTLMDALIPFCDVLSAGGSFEKAVKAAREGAERTKGMEALLGRATYVQVRHGEKGHGIPDPGAWGVCALLEGFVYGMTGMIQERVPGLN